MQEREGRKRDSQRCGKSGGGPNAFIPAPELRTGRLASSDAMPDAAGGEGVHEVAKPDGVIHRYVSNRKSRAGEPPVARLGSGTLNAKWFSVSWQVSAAFE